jgi:2,3-bisphosphoglycerate-dependent phosphoglycerate mutase
MDLFFIRHGQSQNNRLWSETGSDRGRVADPRLTELGRRQAAYLGEFLRSGSLRGGQAASSPAPETGFGVTHVYSSLMLRAVETGSIAARSLGLPLCAWTEIHEEGGIFLADPETGEDLGLPGSDRIFFESNFPELILPEDLHSEGWWGSQPVEPRDARLPRARRFLADLLERHGNTSHRVAIVSHGGFFNLLLKVILNLPSGYPVWFTSYNCAVSWIQFREQDVTIQYLNRTDFLPTEMVS